MLLLSALFTSCPSSGKQVFVVLPEDFSVQSVPHLHFHTHKTYFIQMANVILEFPSDYNNTPVKNITATEK